MSVEATSWALSEAPDVPPQCVAVLLGLANHAHANGRGAFPSQERLAWYARKSVRSVRRDLAELEGLGLIRRGNQAYVAFLPTDRRPVVWDLATGQRRELLAVLDDAAEPQSGRSAAVPEPVDNRGDVRVRADVNGQTTGRRRPSGRTYTSAEPSLTINTQGRGRPMGRRADCPRHRGSPAGNCGPCRADILVGGAA
jgi:hypothetical protein